MLEAVNGNSYASIEIENLHTGPILIENGCSAEPSSTPGLGGKSLNQNDVVAFNWFFLKHINIYSSEAATINLLFS